METEFGAALKFACATGWAAAENIWYLQDLNNVLAEELFPHLTERFDDWIAHPGPGRVADEVAEFYFLHRRVLRIGVFCWLETPQSWLTQSIAPHDLDIEHCPGKTQRVWQICIGSTLCPLGNS